MSEQPAGGKADAHSEGSRTLVIDLAARSRNWSLPSYGAAQLKTFAPPSWTLRFISAQTSSDGDGAARPSDEVMEAVSDAEVYFGFGMPRDLFLAAPRLRWIHSAAAGVASALYPEMRNSDVLFTNSAGVHGAPIAEYVCAGVLYFLRGLDIALEQKQRVVWDKEPFVGDGSPLRELADCEVLIVGTGGLGGEIAKRLSALGAHCTGIRRRPELGAPPGFARVEAQSAIDSELARADIVVLAAPATPSTEGLLSAKRLNQLKRGVIIVNVARGSLLDENALVERLESGAIRGAVLDVFGKEPLAQDSPLWQLRSVLLTPHVSPVSPGRFWERELALFFENWRRYIAGRPLKNVVDKHEGY